jgi:hypothetical protein
LKLVDPILEVSHPIPVQCFYDIPGLPNFPDQPVFDGLYPSILATGITDHGIVEADAQYVYDVHPFVTIPGTWDLDVPRPVPEPLHMDYFLESSLSHSRHEEEDVAVVRLVCRTLSI